MSYKVGWDDVEGGTMKVNYEGICKIQDNLLCEYSEIFKQLRDSIKNAHDDDISPHLREILLDKIIDKCINE